MFLLPYPYQHVPSFKWYLGSQGGERISKPVFIPLGVLYAKGQEFLLQLLRPSFVGCQTLFSQCKVTFHLGNYKIGVSQHPHVLHSYAECYH